MLDEEALLAVCAYIDLNPVAAGMAATPEQSEHTSAKTRVEHVHRQGREADLQQADVGSVAASRASGGLEEDLWLVPIEDCRRLDSQREGMLETFTLGNYKKLMDYTGRLLRDGKASIDAELADILTRIGSSAEAWQARMRRLSGGRLPGRFISGSRERLREHQIKLLLQRIKGSRQERINPDQLLLFSLEELQQIAEQLKQGDPQQDLIDDPPERKQGKKRPRRQRSLVEMLEHLPRDVVRHELGESERTCPCCGEQRSEIGVETSYQLDVIPAQLKALQHERVKYACRHCESELAIAPKPPQPIEKGLPTPGLCAHTVLSKFGDHTPLYRQEDIHSRLGCTIRRSTLCGWQAQLAELALAFVMRMKYLVLLSKVIHTDDTSIKMLDPGAGKAQTCKFWPYLGDWLHPYAVYDFTLTRERDGPREFLAGFEGYLQADAYSGYDCIYASDKVKEVACGIHARRYWHQALDNDPVRANTAPGFIARLSQIESHLRQVYPYRNLQGERDFAAVKAARQEFSVPILKEYRAWLDQESEDPRILPKSAIRAAFTYTLNQWDALCRYTEEGFLSMENNVAERLVKPATIGRKNYLFVGSPNGGRGAATMYSLVSSAKANGVEPLAWLKELFTRLPYHRDGEAFSQAAAEEPVTSDELDYLLPDRWLSANPAHAWHVDHLRRAERKQANRSRSPNR